MNYNKMMQDYDKVYKCIRSCHELKQIPACRKLIRQFNTKHEKKFYLSAQTYNNALSQHLEYQIMKITNHKPQNHDQN